MLLENVNKSVEYIKSKIENIPEIALILGSGLGNFGENIENPIYISYGDIPGFVTSTAPGHKGRLIIGNVNGKTVLCMQGRFHYYEGYSPSEITYPVRVMSKLGIKKLIVTNAAGGLKTEFTPGDLMIINDHINFMRINPLIGKNEEDFGPRFQDMTYGYDLEMRNIVKEVGKDLNLDLKEGVYVGTTGPSFETPAEIKMFQNMGGSAVGMSTIPEVIVANHSGMKVCGISCITNMGAGMLDQPITEEEVIIVAGEVSEKFTSLVKKTIENI